MIYAVQLKPIDKKRAVVARIKAERKIVEGNRELIRLYEAKVKKVIPLRGRCEKVWEG